MTANDLPTTQEALTARFTEAMRSRGFSDGFLSGLTAAHAPLFGLLAQADLPTLLRQPASPKFWREALPEAFRGAGPAEAAETLAVLSALRRALRAAWAQTAALPERPRQKQEVPTGPAQTQSLPSPAQFRARLREIRDEPAVREREIQRQALFGPGAEETEALRAERIRFVQTNYSVRLSRADALRIPWAALNEQIGKGRYGAVNLVRRPQQEQNALRCYAFLTAYCACMRPQYYPFFNRNVQNALCALRDRAGFYPFRNDDLHDYNRYIAVLSIFSETCALQGTPLYDLALYLEAEGKRTATD